jgi:hypothetical protein
MVNNMNKKLETQLKVKYPQLFKDMDGDPYRTCMGRGIETADGWFSLIDELSESITRIDPSAKYSQIKEKFGRLCIYIDDTSDEAWALVSKACQDSEFVCEECGKPGTMSKGPWLSVRCKTHKK